MSAPERRPTRGKPALVAAAAQENNGPVTADQAASGLSAGTTVPSTSTARPAVNRIHLSSASAQVGPDPGSASTVGSTSHPNAPMAFPGLTGTSYSRAPSIASVGSGGAVSVRSTPTIPESSQVGGETVTRMKFKPKVPIRRVKHEPDVKPEIPSGSSMRGGPRGRGRGASRGRGAAPAHSHSIAAGPFGGPRPSQPSRYGASGGQGRYTEASTAEAYSDNEDESLPVYERNVIDIDAVSGLGESAPTSLVRDRKINEKAKGKSKLKAMKDELDSVTIKGKGKAHASGPAPADQREGMEVDNEVDLAHFGVKAERISPVKPFLDLPDPNEGVPPPIGFREDDLMLSDDEQQDRDTTGRRLRMQDGEEEEDEEVNEAQKVDLSESESEEEEETMEGDFIQTDGFDDPREKLFMFQFPHLFPNFKASGPVDMTQDGDTKEAIKDTKPTIAQLRAQKRRGGAPPPEGRIGTLVVMKSGKVKMVLGDGIVMDVTPGVSASFLQQLVHIDSKSKAAVVLGEVNKSFVVTPDIDRLLQELFINGGQTPGDKEAEARKRERMRVKLEGGLMRMDED